MKKLRNRYENKLTNRQKADYLFWIAIVTALYGYTVYQNMKPDGYLSDHPIGWWISVIVNIFLFAGMGIKVYHIITAAPRKKEDEHT